MSKSESKSVSFASNICNNCEAAISTHFCQNCSENDRYFCSTCEQLHTKIKAYRSHKIIKLPGLKSSRVSFLNFQFDAEFWKDKVKDLFIYSMGYVRDYVEYVYEVVKEPENYDSFTYYQTIITCVVLSISTFAAIKLTFGSQAILVVLGFLYAYHYLEESDSKQKKKTISETTKKNLGSKGQFTNNNDNSTRKSSTSHSGSNSTGAYNNAKYSRTGRSNVSSQQSTQSSIFEEKSRFNQRSTTTGSHFSNNSNTNTTRNSNRNEESSTLSPNRYTNNSSHSDTFYSPPNSPDRRGANNTNNSDHSENVSCVDDNLDFKDEFWHDPMECKPARFRPRTRAYKPRVKNAMGSPVRGNDASAAVRNSDEFTPELMT